MAIRVRTPAHKISDALPGAEKSSKVALCALGVSCLWQGV